MGCIPRGSFYLIYKILSITIFSFIVNLTVHNLDQHKVGPEQQLKLKLT